MKVGVKRHLNGARSLHQHSGTTIGRWLDTGDYQPGNCFWQTREQQSIAQACKRLLRKLAADCPELIPDFPLYGLRTASPQLTI